MVVGMPGAFGFDAPNGFRMGDGLAKTGAASGFGLFERKSGLLIVIPPPPPPPLPENIEAGCSGLPKVAVLPPSNG